MLEVRTGVVTVATPVDRPTVLVGGATTAVPVANWVDGYTPAVDDVVLVLQETATRWLIGVKQ